MRFLILGASAPDSIGAGLAERLRDKGCSVTLASRSGRLGISCDITDPKAVTTLVRNEAPDVLIVGAGVFPALQKIGQIEDWDGISALLAAKTVGSLVVLDVAVQSGVRTVIFLAGTELSNDPRMSHFTVANGAIWSAVRFATRHVKETKAYFVELGLVVGTSMANAWLGNVDRTTREKVMASAITIQDIGVVIDQIIEGRFSPGSRICINNDKI